jgi:hypothetical protein
MQKETLTFLYETFAWLVENYGFTKADEINEDRTYSIEYRSDVFIIQLETYRRDIYPTLYRTGDSDNAVSLFNLLSYLNQSSKDVPVFKGFEEEKDLNESYKKQLHYISAIIYDNFSTINRFFIEGDYKKKIEDIRVFMINKYPNLFKKEQ